MKDFLKLQDLQDNEVSSLIDFAIELKKKKKDGIAYEPLKGKVMGMIFSKSSTRTRVSFERGMIDLGGNAIFLNQNDIQLGRGESIKDTARVLERYLDLIMIRTFKQSDVDDLAKFGSIPVINGLTDYAHPTQIIADLQTVKEHKGGLKGLKIAYIGDGNNVCNSLIVGAVKCGAEISIACPAGFLPDKDVLAYGLSKKLLTVTEDTFEAATDADVLYTDVWASMGQESERLARAKVFAGKYQINKCLMSVAHKDAIVLHCLPAHKGEEITEDIFEKHAVTIFDEAENRLHAHKAIMCRAIDIL
ncbi:MAG: ornithine carbamoyltransferase [Christensenellaceae bacterium]|jgi:ornithine carbamoyltransferase|nr:ornithine carbamoyltransferase [Christensenellaceae bacterium]